MLRPKVKIYTTPSCAYCRMAKDFFAKHQVEHEEKDVAKDQAALEEMIKISGQLGVPVIEVGREVFVGFDRAGLVRALNLNIK